ncbi:MAG: hypothetical protein ACKVVP_24475 [Chloroflexota bacterium]
MPLRFLGLISVVIAALVLGAASAYAGDDSCQEPNDQSGVPCSLAADTELQGFLDTYEDWDLYAINVQAGGGTLRIDMIPPGDYRVGLYRPDGAEVVKPLGEGVAPRQFRIPRVQDGTYYIQINSGAGDFSPDLPYKISYTIEADASAQAAFEPIVARPQDLLLRLDEAGKSAKKGKVSEGKGSTGPWYQVAYDRPATYANERSGPLNIVQRMVLSPDVPTAQKAFKELSAQDFPEAVAKRKGKFLPTVDAIGDEFLIVGSCDDGCTGNSQNTHFRTTVRYNNAVFVLYTYGYGGKDGNNEAGAMLLATMALQHLK